MPAEPPPRHSPIPRCVPLTALLLAAASPVAAESLQDVTITATPLRDTPLTSSRPVSVIEGRSLDRRRAPSLGDTVDGLPGVTSTAFGPGASRPVIRGQSAQRVAVTENGLDTLDVSSLSPDHAVVIDPLGTTQIEVLRGPATLLYGSGAIGGLVNGVTDRIPTTAVRALGGDALVAGDSASRGWLGSFRLRGGTAAGGLAGGTPAGGGSLNWSIGGFARDAGDYRIPGNAVVGDPTSPSGRLPNSFTESQGLSGGVSWVDRWGAAGLSYSGIDSSYGIPSEPGVFIDQRNRRTEGLVELDRPFSGVEALRLRGADVQYRHNEIEADTGEVGTAFDSRGRDLRVEAVHAEFWGIRGALGVHGRTRDLSVSGEEAYIPSTREREQALFWVAQRAIGPGQLEFGLRQGRASLDPDGSTGLPSRSFDLTSGSVGIIWPIAGPWSVSANLGSAQRAPSIEELYANGPHAATATFEIGDPTLDKERSRNVELALRYIAGPLRWKLGAYQQRFSNFIAGFSTDDNGDGVADRVDGENQIVNSPDDPGAGEFSRLVYQQAPARFRGIEGEVAWRPEGSVWGVRGMFDAVRGTVDGYGNAPRLPPLRVGLAVDYAQGPWSGFVSLLHATRQDRTAPLETETAGYTRLDAEIAYSWTMGPLRLATLFIQGRNLANDEIRLSTSFVKDSVPMPGRSVYAGLRLNM